MSKRRANKLLLEWRNLKQNRACALFFDLQQSKYNLESLADCLTTEVYCSSSKKELDKACDLFECELIKYKDTAQQDLLAGLKKYK